MFDKANNPAEKPDFKQANMSSRRYVTLNAGRIADVTADSQFHQVYVEENSPQANVQTGLAEVVMQTTDPSVEQDNYDVPFAAL